MHLKIEPRFQSWVIIGACVTTLAIILVAGLWPFHSPKNDVTWLADEDGIRLGTHGCLMSSGPVQTRHSEDESSGSLELWIKPALVTKERRTIVAIEGPGDDRTAFAVQQNGNTLILHRKNIDETGVFRTAEITIREALAGDSRIALTITMGPHETKAYRNGVLTETTQLMGRAIPPFAGRLVLGNFLGVGGTWPGEIYGLAMYGRQLAPAEVLSHSDDWNKSRSPTVTSQDQPIALYLFTERAGRIVHEQLGSQNSLVIPPRYTVLHPGFLSLPWRNFRFTPGFWIDTGINIIGFVPFGLCFFAYLSMVRPIRNTALIVVLLGFLTSLSIEVLQAWLPTRNSGLNDLITNTLGTGLGVLLFRSLVTRIFPIKQQLGNVHWFSRRA